MLLDVTHVKTQPGFKLLLLFENGKQRCFDMSMYMDQKGMQKGRQEGIRQGSYNTYFNLIQNMKKNKVSEKDIANFINVDIDIVKKIINKEQVDIPLHLNISHEI